MAQTTLARRSTGFTVVYALEQPPDSYEKAIFLVGPTPRKPNVPSWRPEAIDILRRVLKYDGVVFVPEVRPNEHGVSVWHGDNDAQVTWEEDCLERADVIPVWLPRNMETMPALTSNDEWGRWKYSGKVVLGAPEGADSVRYQLWYGAKLQIPVARTLKDTLANAIEMIGEGAVRSHGERDVPLYIWRTPQFQRWYQAHLAVGNVLERLRVEWVCLVGPQRNIVFMWALHVSMYVAAEGRSKSNEVILGRRDISSVLLYQRRPVLEDSIVVLAREFRSTVSNASGYVWELPGGSSFDDSESPAELAAHECEEEVGLVLPAQRFTAYGARQLAATSLVHKAWLFAAELTDDEVGQLRSMSGKAQGVVSEGEQTYVEVTTYGEILRSDLVDWSTLGMLAQVLV